MQITAMNFFITGQDQKIRLNLRSTFLSNSVLKSSPRCIMCTITVTSASIQQTLGDLEKRKNVSSPGDL